MPWSSLALDGLLELLLGVAPTNKVLYGSDESTDPEVLWLSAQVGREALERVLTKALRARLGRRRRGACASAPACSAATSCGSTGSPDGDRGRDPGAAPRPATASLVALHFADMAGMSRVKVIPLRRLETVAALGHRLVRHLGGRRASTSTSPRCRRTTRRRATRGWSPTSRGARRCRSCPATPGRRSTSSRRSSSRCRVCPRHVLRLAQDRAGGRRPRPRRPRTRSR